MIYQTWDEIGNLERKAHLFVFTKFGFQTLIELTKLRAVIEEECSCFLKIKTGLLKA